MKEHIYSLIKNPEKINEHDITKLESLIFKYPYFQNAQLLLTKGLLNISSIRYNEQLKKASAYSLKRENLFKLITSHKNNQTIKREKIKNKKSVSDNLKLGDPLKFKKEDKYSFSEWLNLSNVKKINRKNKSMDENLVNKFIDNNTLNPAEKANNLFFKASSAAKKSLIEDTELITPTLAKVYLEQKHYDKAINAYERLCLKYPQKNSLFADKIKLIKKLKEQ